MRQIPWNRSRRRKKKRFYRRWLKRHAQEYQEDKVTTSDLVIILGITLALGMILLLTQKL